jgi:hypothetical protein
MKTYPKIFSGISQGICVIKGKVVSPEVFAEFVAKSNEALHRKIGVDEKDMRTPEQYLEDAKKTVKKILLTNEKNEEEMKSTKMVQLKAALKEADRRLDEIRRAFDNKPTESNKAKFDKAYYIRAGLVQKIADAQKEVTSVKVVVEDKPTAVKKPRTKIEYVGKSIHYKGKTATILAFQPGIAPLKGYDAVLELDGHKVKTSANYARLLVVKQSVSK